MKKMLKILCLAIVMLFPLVLTSCGTKYIAESSKTVPIKKGEKSPYNGWILTDKAVIDLLDCCEGKLE